MGDREVLLSHIDDELVQALTSASFWNARASLQDEGPLQTAAETAVERALDQIRFLKEIRELVRNC